jgi:membrane protein YdbS with pleckstrin-like domain
MSEPQATLPQERVPQGREKLEPVTTPWQRVSPRYVIVDFVGTLIFGLIVVVATSMPALLAQNPFLLAIPAAFAIIFIVTLALVKPRVRSIGFQLREDDLLFRRGLMWQRFVAVPYGRMQLVDINRGPLDRAVGLSELKFVTAAASSGITIPGLPAADAEELRDRLVALAESRRAGL